MLLSAVSVLVAAQSSSEIPEGLMNNPVLYAEVGWVDGQGQAVCGLVGSDGIFVVPLGMRCSLVVELQSMLSWVSAVWGGDVCRRLAVAAGGMFVPVICIGGDRLSQEISRIRPRRKPWLLEWCGINWWVSFTYKVLLLAATKSSVFLFTLFMIGLNILTSSA